MSFQQDSQGFSNTPQITEHTTFAPPEEFGSSGEFKLGDFSSKLLKRAQTQTSEGVPVLASSMFAFSKTWSRDARVKHALMAEAFEAGRLSAARGPQAHIAARQQRKARSEAGSEAAHPSPATKPRESERGVPPVPSQHAATFNTGTSSQADAEAQYIDVFPPVKSTFIHFNECEGPQAAGMQRSSSAPVIMMNCEHRTKYPEMEAAHIRGECRPCFYNTKKADGCRHGTECEYCHLCPVGSFQKRRKERVNAIKEQDDRIRRREGRRCMLSGPDSRR